MPAQRAAREARRGMARLARPEIWIPAAYVGVAGAWIALSDQLAASLSVSREQLEAWSMAKGFGFVAVTGLLLHLGVRQALARERRAARRLVEVEARLQQAQRLESVGRLAGGVAHDFNNLLTVVLGSTEVLRESLDAGRAAPREEVEEIRAAAMRASELTRQLLAFARKQVIEPVPLDLNEVVRGAERMLRRVLVEDVALRVDLQPELWRTLCDPGQMQQVLLNLAVNARDAMPRGGTLTLRTRNEPDGAPGRAGEGEWVSLAVSDDGAGMSSEVKEHLFEPFFTTKPPGAGTGLGLASVYGIVRQSGGEVHVESEPGRGSTITVCFPRHHGPGAPAPATATPSAAGGSETILVVEDDRQVREVTVRTLRGAGYRVLVAGGSEEALALAARDGDRPHLVVTDVVMPGQDGHALASVLRLRHEGLSVLFVSGYTQDVLHHRGVLDSGVQFLPKPFTPAALLARIRTILDQAASSDEGRGGPGGAPA
ncbi:MAG TPA: ATP-binding protein [Anaeromyxobacter sp.]|nr:ATP-binding protein [Anaeromyxobacter sp.]